jgi:hypothetical protein
MPFFGSHPRTFMGETEGVGAEHPCPASVARCMDLSPGRVCPVPSVNHLLITTLDRLDRGAHAFSECTAIKDFSHPLAAIAGIPVQLVLTV